MRIAIMTMIDLVPWGGSELLWAAMARSAVREGHEVFASVYRHAVFPEPLRQLQEAGVIIHRRPLFSSSRIAKLRDRLRNPCRELIDFKPDVMLINLPYIDHVARPERSRHLRMVLDTVAVPYVTVLQGCGAEPPVLAARRAVARDYLVRAQHVVPVARRAARVLERQLAVSLPRTTVVCNPVNLPDRSFVAWPHSELASLAIVARVDNIKGHDILLEALSQKSWHDRPWHLHVYGEGPMLSFYKDLAAHYGLGERVTFAGHVADVRAIWASNQILVLPSRTEGAPLVVVEAMLCGRPTVMTDVGGAREWLDEGETGFIAEGCTLYSFSKALERAWQARDRWEDMGRRAHEVASHKADPDPGKTLLNVVLSACR